MSGSRDFCAGGGLFTPENFQLYISGNRARGNDMDRGLANPDPAGELSSYLERQFEITCRTNPEHMRGWLHYFSQQHKFVVNVKSTSDENRGHMFDKSSDEYSGRWPAADAE